MHPMLTDFGIARLADSPGLTRTHEFVGTPAYVAPESAEGRPQTSAVDIYGAGILLYELVTGRPPFAGGTALEVLHQHLSEEPRRPSTVPEPLWTVIERCLRKKPGRAAQRREPRPRAARRRRRHRRARHRRADRRPRSASPRCSPPTRRPAPVPGRRPGRGRPDAGAAARAGARASYDPNAATSVLPHTGGPAAGDADQRGAADPTAGHAARAARPRPSRPAAAGPRTRTPGRTSCARPATATSRRRSSTSTRARTRCAAARSAQPPAAAAAAAAAPQQQQPQQPPQRRSSYAPPQQHAPQPQQYAPPQPQQPQRRTQPPPQQPAAPRRAAAQPRQRSANPMKIPGLGCLKGCLFTIVILFVGGLADLGADAAPGLDRHRARASGTQLGDWYRRR